MKHNIEAYVELVEDEVIFNLSDLVAIVALQDFEKVRSREPFNTRLTLRGRPMDVLLITPYAEVRNQVFMAARKARSGEWVLDQ